MIRSKLWQKFIVLILLLALLATGLFSQPALARNSEFLNKDKLELILKGVISLYMLNRLNSLRREDNPPEHRDRVPGKSPSLAGQIIVLDPGHGGSDPGAIGAGGLKEKDVNLDIAKRVYRLLKENTGAQVYLTRDTDRFISLAERSSQANKLGADLFISIHINAAENGRERGIETYAYHNASRENWALAWYLQEQLVKELGLLDRGIKAGNFHVIRETRMNSVLLEIGFISDAREEALLAKTSTRERAAQAIYAGIINYYQNI
ncbi:MAG: N-acetylmuramoyl-L-alanine amidase [Bacillota bacterium]|nr:N-acetylmuramoyl-L-alanine amidase [Bacillota bacterium]